jgi:hypothetical protein
MLLTKPQREALKKVYHRAEISHSYGPHQKHFMGYREFRRGVLPGPGCVMVRYAGMWLGIEPDGYTHS